MRKIIFPQKKKFLGDLGIYPASPSYSLTLPFNDSIQLQLSLNAYHGTCLEFLNRKNLNFKKGVDQVEATSPTQDHRPRARFENTMTWETKIISTNS
jgi:hypothetical protein